MTKPFRFEKAGPRTYTVIATADQAVLGSVDRLSPDHATLSPKWRGTVLDGPDAGSHHRTRDAAAQAIVDAAAHRNDAPSCTHPAGWQSRPGDPASIRCPHCGVVKPTPADPEYAHRGDDALRIMGARGDDAALAELDRRRAEERAAWNEQYARGNKPAETPADDLAPGTADAGYSAPDVVTMPALDLPSAPGWWIVTFTETTTYRAAVPAVDLPDSDDYADRQAAALLDLARDALGDGAIIVSSGAAFVQADPITLPETLWLCGECYEELARDLAQCEDGCSRNLDHVGACHPRDHDGETCTRCGGVDRLTPYGSGNLDADQAVELAELLDLPVCPRCKGRHETGTPCGGPEDQDPGPWDAPTSLAPAELARLRAVADRARETGAARATDPGAL